MHIPVAVTDLQWEQAGLVGHTCRCKVVVGFLEDRAGYECAVAIEIEHRSVPEDEVASRLDSARRDVRVEREGDRHVFERLARPRAKRGRRGSGVDAAV